MHAQGHPEDERAPGASDRRLSPRVYSSGASPCSSRAWPRRAHGAAPEPPYLVTARASIQREAHARIVLGLLRDVTRPCTPVARRDRRAVPAVDGPGPGADMEPPSDSPRGGAPGASDRRVAGPRRAILALRSYSPPGSPAFPLAPPGASPPGPPRPGTICRRACPVQPEKPSRALSSSDRSHHVPPGPRVAVVLQAGVLSAT